MSSNGKREIIRSIDHLIYCQFVYSYFLDSSLLVLLFRFAIQLQLLSPKALTRSIRTACLIVTAGWLVVIILHVTSEPGQPGIIIDFIGNAQPPTMQRLLLLDFLLYVFQLLRVLITSDLSSQLLLNGTAVATLQVPPALAAALGAENLTLMLPPSDNIEATEDPELNSQQNRRSVSSPAATNDDSSQMSSAYSTTENSGLFYGDELVVDIGLRNSLRKMIFADNNDPSIATDGLERLPV